MFISNNCASFQFWLKENLVEHEKVSKYYENDCRYQISVWTGNSDFIDQICQKRVFPVENRKSEHRHWILRIRIGLGAMALPGQSRERGRERQREWERHTNTHRETQRERELTIYSIAGPRAKFANENAMALLGQVRDSWPSMVPLGHMELTKTQEIFILILILFLVYILVFIFVFQFCFSFHFRFCFHFCFCFRFCFLFVFIFVFAFVLIFVFVLFIFGFLLIFFYFF